MPCDLNRYPPYWKQFSRWIRFERARGRCECTGQCGKHTNKNGGWRCTEVHGRPAAFANGNTVLSTAHLCTCDPPCAKPAHVIAACQRCHLRIDRDLHVTHKRQRGTLFTPEWVKAAHETLRSRMIDREK